MALPILGMRSFERDDVKEPLLDDSPEIRGYFIEKLLARQRRSWLNAGLIAGFSLLVLANLSFIYNFRPKTPSEIPNLVHYVHLGKPNETLEFPFIKMLSLLSSHYRLQPDTLNVYTNLDWTQASQDHYTQAVLRIPSVKFHHVDLRLKTSQGKKFTGGFSHESDFMRTDILSRYGGVYMDTDIFVAKDLKPLRQTPFKMVIGRQIGGAAACGIMLARKDSLLLDAYRRLQDKVYDGSWAHHAIDLLDQLVQIYSEVPNEVLFLDRPAFYPFSWMERDIATLFDPSKGPPRAEGIACLTCDKALINEQDLVWHRDERWLSYTYHGFFHAMEGIPNTVKESWFGPSLTFTEEYIKAGKSLFAVSMQPVLLQAEKDQLIRHFDNAFH